MLAESSNQPCKAVIDDSPFSRLNGELNEKNARLEELVKRIENKLHKLSDTNVPTGDNCNKEVLPELPFRDGHLLDYYFRIQAYSNNITRLLIQVEKLESLI